MKTTLSLIAILIASSMSALANQVSIDCQNPGWLSSMISYPQQQEIEQLSIQGYINETDMLFINNLITNGKISVLNLLNAKFIKDGKIAETLPDNMFTYHRTRETPMNKIILPKNIESISYKLGDYSFVDTIAIGNKKISKAYYRTSPLSSAQSSVKNIVLLDGVQEIMPNAFFTENSSYSEIPKYIINNLPNSLIRIHGKAISKGITINPNISIPSNIVSIGDSIISRDYHNYSYNEWCAETFTFNAEKIALPSSLKFFNADKYNGTESIFLSNSPKCNTYLNCDTLVIPESTEVLRVNINTKIAIFKCQIPPVATSIGEYKIEHLYVPKGCIDAYNESYNTFISKGFIKSIKEIKEIESLRIDNSNINCYIGDIYQIYATIYPSDCIDKTLIWHSSDESVATIDSHGMLRALKNGTTTITVSSNNGVQSSCEVTVLTHVNGITLAPKTLTIDKLGSQIAITPIITPIDASNKSISWSSSNPMICHVSDNGVITALDYGYVIVSATTNDGGYSDYCVIEIKSEQSIINDIHSSPIDISNLNSKIIIENIPSKTLVRIYSIDGKLLYNSYENNSSLEYNTPNKGIYIIYINSDIYKLLVK